MLASSDYQVAPRHADLLGPIAPFVAGFEYQTHRCFAKRVMPDDCKWETSFQIGACEANCIILPSNTNNDVCCNSVLVHFLLRC